MVKRLYILIMLFISIMSAKANINADSIYTELVRQNIPHADIVLRQAKLESGNFKSKLTKTHNNVLGIKQGNKYKKYSHYSECITDYKKKISSRYRKGECYYKFLTRIGYAKNPEYIKLLKRIK